MIGRSSPPGAPKRRELVLVGGGHAHVQVLRRFAMRPIEGVRLTVVVDRWQAVYSGMVPGLVAGDYAVDELTIDVLPLARRAGASCIRAAAVGVDPEARRIALEGRPSIPYDVASLDVGSTVRDRDLPGVDAHAIPTRPIARFVEAIDARIARAEPGAHLRAVVVGGGAAGVELALCLEARLRAAGHSAEVSLLAASTTLLSGAHAQLAPRVLDEAASRGIGIRCGVRAVAVESDAVVVEPVTVEPAKEEDADVSGAAHARADRDARAARSRVPSDLTLWATGAAAPSWLGDGKLPLTPAGFVRVDDRLAVPGCPGLFAAGDCAVPDEAAWVPRAGVYAVRQGPVLDHNLRARLADRPLRRYTPQRDFLALLNLGDRRAIGGKWGLALSGRAVFHVKDWIDRRFVRRFQVLDAPGRPAPGFPPPGGMAGDEEMACGGCAAKLGATPLSAALAALPPPPPDPSVRLGLAEADDAAAVTLPRGDLLLASVDAFRAFTDDPWLVGRVAAVNATHDVLAKGAMPRHALALVTVPDDAPDRQAETLHQVLAGVRAALDPLGVALVGGHTTTGPELFVGLSVTGVPIEAGRLLDLASARPGDVLVSTRPLGSGVLLAADMRGLATGTSMDDLLAQLVRDSAAAARAAVAHGARAATDVSGFGLAGHLLELLDRSGTDAELFGAAILAHRDARALLRSGLRSTFHEQNAVARARVDTVEPLDEVTIELLFDPQTAGGLLIAAPPERADALVAALRASGEDLAAAVGVLRSPRAAASRILLRPDEGPI